MKEWGRQVKVMQYEKDKFSPGASGKEEHSLHPNFSPTLVSVFWPSEL